MFNSRILAAVSLVLFWMVWISLDQLTLEDIPRTAMMIATRVNRAVIREASAVITKFGFTEVETEKVLDAPAGSQRTRTRGPIRSIAPVGDANQPTSEEVTVASPGRGPADIDDSSEPIVVASEAGVAGEIAEGDDGNGVDK